MLTPHVRRRAGGPYVYCCGSASASADAAAGRYLRGARRPLLKSAPLDGMTGSAATSRKAGGGGCGGARHGSSFRSPLGGGCEWKALRILRMARAAGARTHELRDVEELGGLVAGAVGLRVACIRPRCNVMHHVATCAATRQHVVPHVATRGALQHVAPRCNTWRHAATRGATLQHVAPRCSMRRHVAPRCDMLH